VADKDSLITKEKLHELFEYRDGLLYKKSNGQECLSFDTKGYKRVKINYKHYFVHRIIFMMHHGFLPKYLDHIDCNRTNNKIENLREATLKENCRNRRIGSRNKSGVKGVCWELTTKKWVAYCTVDYKQHVLGRFDNIEEAADAVSKFRKQHHGDFSRV